MHPQSLLALVQLTLTLLIYAQNGTPAQQQSAIAIALPDRSHRAAGTSARPRSMCLLPTSTLPLAVPLDLGASDQRARPCPDRLSKGRTTCGELVPTEAELAMLHERQYES